MWSDCSIIADFQLSSFARYFVILLTAILPVALLWPTIEMINNN